MEYISQFIENLDFSKVRNGNRYEMGDGVVLAVFLGNAGCTVQVLLREDDGDLFPSVMAERTAIGTGDLKDDLSNIMHLVWSDWRKVRDEQKTINERYQKSDRYTGASIGTF